MAESTKERIINAAFSFYKVPNFERVSLSQIAGRVGISKAAIFKHFKNKEALTQEMNNRIFESLIQVFEPMTVLYNQDRPGEAISYIVKFLITHREYLVYLLSMSIMFNENFVVNELRNRGVEIFDNVFDKDGKIKDVKQYIRYQFMGITLISFVMKRFHNQDFNSSNVISEEEFSDCICFLIENGIAPKGISIDSQELAAIDSKCMEEMKSVKSLDKMLGVIAGIIDTVGISGLTIEKIASSLGMAKSSLYSSFDNKVDMISTLIENEFLTLNRLIASNVEKVSASYEKHYAIMQSELCYFKARPELILLFRNLMMNQDSLKQLAEIHKCSSEWSMFTDSNSTEISSETVLMWIMILPVMIADCCIKKGLNEDVIQDSIKDVFLMVEFGLKNRMGEKF